MLRSISKISGIKLVALDGEIGSVEDYFFDNQNWIVRYLVVDAGSWLDRKRLLFSPASVRLPDGNEKDILIGVKKEMIETALPSMQRDLFPGSKRSN